MGPQPPSMTEKKNVISSQNYIMSADKHFDLDKCPHDCYRRPQSVNRVKWRQVEENLRSTLIFSLV